MVEEQKREQKSEESKEKKPQSPEKMADPKDLEENKGITFLSYIGILCLIPLLAKKESAFAQYHSKQGLVLLGCLVVCAIFGVVPILGQIIWLLAWLSYIVLAIMGLLNVSKGVIKPLPIIGSLALKINL